MKWLIVEDALRDRKGHWLEYVSTFVRELRVLGDEVVVLCDWKAQGFVMEQTGARPVLPESIWHRMGDGAGALKRYLRVPGHAIATFFVMRMFLKKFNHRGHGEHGVGGKREIKCQTGRIGETHGNAQGTFPGAAFSNPSTSELSRDSENTSLTRSASGPAVALDSRPSTLDSSPASPDWIFVPTVLVHHLLGWWLLLKTGSVPRESRVLLFFPNLPIRLDESGKAHWTGGPTTKLMAWLFASLRKKVESGRVVLGVETHAMRRALEGLIQMPVTYLPHPVEAAQSPRTDSGRLRTEVEDQNIDSSNNPLFAICHPPSGYAKSIVFGCYGAARWEKGSDVLQAAIRLVLQEKPEIPANFVFQWLEDFKDEHGLCVSLDPWMREHPKVEVVERYFNEGEIHLRLAETDVMVLPYRKPYRLRVSRVVIEAMLNGMPVIATEDTTLLEQANEHGCGLACQEGSAESLARAILQAAANSDLMQRVAKEKAPEVQRNFSVDRFRQLLMNQTTKRQRQ